MITFNEQAGIWAWSNEAGEQGEAEHFYEARIMSLSRKIAAAIQGSYKIPSNLKEDAIQEAYAILLRQMGEDPEMAQNTDSWIIYRGWAYAASYCSHIDCTTRRNEIISPPDGEEKHQQIHELVDPFSWAEAEDDLSASAFVQSLQGSLKAVAVGLAAGMLKQDIASMIGVSPTMITKHCHKLRGLWEAYAAEAPQDTAIA